jgi:hypothetical protein
MHPIVLAKSVLLRQLGAGREEFELLELFLELLLEMKLFSGKRKIPLAVRG